MLALLLLFLSLRIESKTPDRFGLMRARDFDAADEMHDDICTIVIVMTDLVASLTDFVFVDLISMRLVMSAEARP